jgi:sulfite exporter TauE/SafE
MIEYAAINSPGAAFVAGLITSLHCAGMCGPLACSLMPVRGDRADAQTVSTVYHVSRLGAYALLGAVAGGLGAAPLTWVSHSALRWLPWVLVFFFVALALRWDRYLPKLLALTRITWRLQAWLRGRSRVEAAVAMGLATPLLPCGPLYFLVALALLSGSTTLSRSFVMESSKSMTKGRWQDST